MKRKLSVLFFALILVFCSMTVSAAPKTMPDGGTFDPVFYAATYPDVRAAFGTDENLLYQHYLLAGRAEGRLPFAPGASASGASSVMTMPDGGRFDPVFYAATYPDVAAAFGTDANLLYQHYLLAGKAEGRLPYAGAASSGSTAKAAPAAGYPGYGPGQSTLRLTSGSLSACYKLMRTDGSLAMEVLLGPGSSTTRSFPCGTYVLKSAQGSRWISESQAFGPSGIYSQSVSYTFEAGYTYEIVSSTTHGDFNRSSMANFVK